MGTSGYIETDDVLVATNRIDKFIKLSQERLATLGDAVERNDIQSALRERDENGRPTASVSIVMEYIDPATFEVIRTVHKINTINADVGISGGSDFATLKLNFDYKLDKEKIAIWNCLERYGEETAYVNADSKEIPCLTVISVPLMLGGKYALVCTDPIAWCLQPVDACSDDNNQIRIDFHVEDTEFLFNRNFDIRSVANEIRSEMVSAKWENEMKQQKEESARAYIAAREKEVKSLLGANISGHTFSTDALDAYVHSRTAE